MIEYREIEPPVPVPAGGPYQEVIDDLIDTTPPGRVLHVGRHIYPLPVSHDAGAVRVLDNGHGLLRVFPAGTDVTDNANSQILFHLSGVGDRRVLMDVVEGQPDKLAIKHLFIYKPGYSPGRKVRPRRTRQGGQSAS
jgi:hypothetical protein